MDQLPRLGKRELICLLLFTCNYVVFVWRGFLFLWVLGTGYVILLWYSLGLPYYYFGYKNVKINFFEEKKYFQCRFYRTEVHLVTKWSSRLEFLCLADFLSCHLAFSEIFENSQ